MRQKITRTLVQSLEPKETGSYEVSDTRERGLVLRVEPGGRKTYYLRYRTAGGRKGRSRRLKLGRVDEISLEQARRKATEHRAAVAAGEDPVAEKKVPDVVTLGDLVDNHYAEWVRLHRRSGDILVKRIKQCFGDWWDKPLVDINSWLLRKYQSQRLKGDKEKGGVKAATIGRDISSLRGAIRYALDEGMLAENPLDGLKPLKVDSTPIVRYLSDDERKRLNEALQARDERLKAGRASGNRWCETRGYETRQDLTECRYGDHLTPLIMTALNTGLRRRELFRLRWSDIDLDQRVLTVRAEAAKAGKVRRIPLNQTLLDVLTGWRRQCDQSNSIVFPSPKTGGELDNVRKAWTALLEEAGITGFRFHDLRHDFASRMAMRGIPLRAIQQLLGHSTIALTERYSHLAPSAMTEAVNSLDEAVPPKTVALPKTQSDDL